ncbi:hypothetical protein PVAP13_7NG439101 [Panicum virgatum]|uniref:Uncharacterized protein n=1 Tax=Panicum virgatum TaxID=38727 RepID=A0A8T0Q710_PANVG|nr:hypothetical protein PVAP13_7NG439101 [Panicum virgatum]
MEHTNMSHSIIQICLELMHLPLKKTNHYITLHYLSTMLQNLKLKLCNSVISPSNSLLKPLNLSISQTKTSLESMGQVYHLLHVLLLKNLIGGLSIHIPGHSLNSLLHYISN